MSWGVAQCEIETKRKRWILWKCVPQPFLNVYIIMRSINIDWQTRVQLKPSNSNCRGKLKLLRVTGVLCYNWVLKKKKTRNASSIPVARRYFSSPGRAVKTVCPRTYKRVISTRSIGHNVYMYMRLHVIFRWKMLWLISPQFRVIEGKITKKSTWQEVNIASSLRGFEL